MRLSRQKDLPRKSRGFGLFEMVVNLGLMASTLVMIATLVSWASGTVSSTSGKLAASEKAESIRRMVAADLAAVPSISENADLVRCSASDTAWSLHLRLPSRDGGWEEIAYAWDRRKGTVTRADTKNGKTTERVIGTGISKVESRWMAKATQESENSPQSWNDAEAPALLRLEIKTTHFREEGNRDDVREVHVDSSSLEFLLPVGGGPVAL